MALWVDALTYLLFEHPADLLGEVHELVHVPDLLRGPKHARVVHKRPGKQAKTKNKQKQDDKTQERIGGWGRKRRSQRHLLLPPSTNLAC